ncbi:MAG TPA: DUF6056 family protein [Kofleriaceae bacterium]
MTWGRVLRVLFIAYVAATAVHIGLVMVHEPFGFDAWNLAADTRAQPFTLGRWLGYGAYEYTHANPRLGQWWTYLAYKLVYFAPIATPVAYLALAFAVSVLGLGRSPGREDDQGRRRLGRDLALVSLAIGFAWFALPRLGMIMFCRAYGANYVYSAALQLWFLVPLRLARGPARRRACAAYGVLGVLAGMCNEHTGPTLIVFVAGYALWQRRAARPARLTWAGAIGLAVGFAAIFFAPGQGSRYDGLATKVSLVGRLLQRGVINNLDIFHDWLLGCAPVLGLVALVVIIARDDREPALRPALRVLGLALAAGTLITVTVFVSPKLGPRFYLLGCALVLAGWIAIADRGLISTPRLAPFVVLAVAASSYAGVRSLPLYYRLAEASDDRLAGLRAAPPGGAFTAEAFEQVEDSWWFLGDDFRDVKKRQLVADYFGLHGVLLRAVDLDAPLGLTDVQLVPRYQVTPASCLDDIHSLDLGALRGIDINVVHKAMQLELDRLRGRLAAAHITLDRLDYAVDFTGAPPPALPRPSLLVGRWTPAGLQAPVGSIDRKGPTRTRTVKLPAEFAGTDAEIYVYLAGGEAHRLGTGRDRDLEFVPWKRGAYWALACQATECFVFYSMRVN